MMSLHLALKLQCVETGSAQAVDILAFYENALLKTEGHLCTLTFGNISLLALERAIAARAGFDLMLRHRLKIYCQPCVEH